ncbi:transcription factor MYB3R-4-like isoform X2 [Phalaenopsis equestris]|uniref:transcription factor MYB3R-4-like isoform X2 n=1 Tax=Phalaenopsis equestris TaxID=78828 RepID=UPI0009E1BB79|nr:transcription factor MYB3R-4-like isoform X2 [Phalaenopsis equestris]
MGSVKRKSAARAETGPSATVQDGRVGSSSAATPDGMGEASSSTSLLDGSDCDFLRQQQALHGRITGPKRRSTKGQWTPEEDEILCNAVHHFHGKNWKKIAECFPDRTDVQCLHRWQKVLNPSLVKGPWSKEEDEIIVEMVKKHGPKKWSTISQALPGRIGKQCRERWHNHLNPTINKDAWTQEEEMALIQAHQIYGNKWAELTKFLPGRSDNSIKNHWNSSVKKKLESYMVQGLIGRYPGLTNVNSSTSRIRKKNHDGGLKERPDMEDSSECSSSALVASSQSECEMAKPVVGEDAIKEEAMDSHLPVCSSEYYGSVEKMICDDVPSEVHSTGNLLPKDEGSATEIKKPSETDSNDNDHENKDILFHKPTPLETSTSGAGSGFENKDKTWISLHNGCSSNLFDSVTTLGMENLDCAAALSYKSAIHRSGTSMNFVPFSYPIFPVNTSHVYGIPCFQNLTTVPPSFICPSASVEIQDTSWRLQNSGAVAGLFIGVPKSGCPAALVPEASSLIHETIDQQLESVVQEQEKLSIEETLTATDCCDNVSRNLSLINEEKVEQENVLEPGTVSPAEKMKEIQSENFLDSGSLFYEPPRIQSLEFPFVCCDIVSSDLQQAYSPLGIRQLMMSSASCNLWDSPSRDDSPDGILKHAAKSFICTPSIMKKRQRELLSPLQERRSDKKYGTDMNRGSFFVPLMKGDEAYIEDMIGEVDPENVYLSLVDDVRDSSSDLKDKHVTITKQNENLGAKLTQKSTCSKSSRASKLKQNVEDWRYGTKVPSDVDSDAKEAQCNAVLAERISSNLESLSACSTFISPGACGTKHAECSVTLTSLQYPPSSKKPQIAVEKFAPSIDADHEIFNIFADTPGIKKGLDSPSSWKSPLFLNSFLAGADFTCEDFRYFMSPGERSYDALGLMKQLSEKNAGVIAEAQEVLSNGGQKLNFDNVKSNNSSRENEDSAKEQENLIPMPSNIVFNANAG